MRYLPLVVAHDGCEDSLPHTLEAALHGLDAGADIVEVDIRVTRDDVVVLRHDGSFSVDGSEVPVGELSFSRLKELRKAGRITDRKPVGRITRLEEILRAAGGRGAMINLDVKEDGVIEPAVRIVRENNMIDQIVFSGCETDRARYLKSHHRECQVLLNVSETQYRVGLADYAEFVRTVCDEAVEAACCGLNVYHTFCNEELIFRAQRRFLPVSVWTVDEAERMKHFLELGVYAITTNRVKALRRLM